MPTIIEKRFKIIEQIGEGGMGVVHRGVDMKTDKAIAIKQLKQEAIRSEPSLIKRFQREGQILRQVYHPNIVRRIAGPMEHKGSYYIIMEYIDGGTLEHLLKRAGRLPVDKALSIVLEVCDALARAHLLGVIHRDLKPANILLTHNGSPRLTDFGIAHVADSTRLTTTNAVMGTWAYLSPEAVRGEKQDESTDVWSLGIMLYEMLQGTIPYRDVHPSNIVAAILHDELVIGHHIPTRVGNLISKMLEKDQGKRPSMRAVGAEIDAILNDKTPVDITPSSGFIPEFAELVESWLIQYQHVNNELNGTQTVDQQRYYYTIGVHATLRTQLAEIQEALTRNNITLPRMSNETHFAPMTLLAVKELFNRARIKVIDICEYEDYMFCATFPPHLRETNQSRLALLEHYMPNITVLMEGYTDDNTAFIDFAFKRPAPQEQREYSRT